MQVTDLIRYNHILRELYFDAMAKLPWAQIVEPKGLSFDSMRNVFLHLTLVEDRWINYIIPARFNQWVDPDFDSFKNTDSLKKYMQDVKYKTEGYFSKLSLKKTNKQIAIPWGDKPDTKISIETALYHMVMEDMIHYGELSAVLWQMNLEAPYLGFWRYKHIHP
jgi:uncharacterized damage-inducible protein DinB